MKFLKNHPFVVEANFDSSVVLTFAVPKEALQGTIPACLTLDTFQDKWAFIAIAMVKTVNLRPKGFPAFLGNDFFLIGYRIFVRYTNNAGKRLRGLYILKSETDKKKMEFLGNLFTHYNYTTTDIFCEKVGKFRTISSQQSGFRLTIEETNEAVSLPGGSPFTDWKEARRFAGPLPHTFTCNVKDKTVLIVEGVRQDWTPQPIKVANFHFDFLDRMELEGLVLANAFEIKNIPYYWEKGKLEKWA